jgi:hypothetical protein
MREVLKEEAMVCCPYRKRKRHQSLPIFPMGSLCADTAKE